MDVAVSPDDQRLAFAQHDRSVTVRSAATGQLQWILRGHQDRVRGVAFTPDGQFLLSGSEDATAKLWDLATGEGRDLTRSHFLAVHSVAFSPDAGRLLTGSGGREAVKLWDTATLQEVCTLEGEGTLFRGLQCSADGNLIAAISCEGLAHIWRAPSWAVIEAAERVQADTTISDMTRPITGDTEERLGAADLPREPGGAARDATSGR